MKNSIQNIEKLGFPWATEDPFLFTAHHLDAYPSGNAQAGLDQTHKQGRNIGSDFELRDGFRMYHGSDVPGFPYHPHRGFETISITTKGLVDHTDSLGASGRYGEGDVQWMTAGKGVQHSEMFPMVNQEGGNELEMFQVWLNLPAKNKMVDPHFKMLWADEIPVVEEADHAGAMARIKVIAGPYKSFKGVRTTDNSWAADPENGVTIYTIDLEAGAEWSLEASEIAGVTRNFYFYEGENLTVDQTLVDSYSKIKVDADESTHFKAGPSGARILMLQGKPIGEPVVKYGPFVMNSQREIMQTFDDYNKTQFGGWPWPEKEQTHGIEKGRFAQFVNGDIEHPSENE